MTFFLYQHDKCKCRPERHDYIVFTVALYSTGFDFESPTLYGLFWLGILLEFVISHYSDAVTAS